MNCSLIRNVTVFDGTGIPPWETDILIEGDRFKAIARGISPSLADEVFDGRGLAAAPGFIDAHGHSDLSLLASPSAAGKIAQGITTEVAGNCGLSVFPLTVKNREHLESLYSQYGEKLTWDDIDGYAAVLRQRRPAINLLSLCGHNTLRAAVAGYEQRELSPRQLAEAERRLASALDKGAAGISTGLLYIPGKFASDTELETLLRVVAARGRLHTTHLRSEGRFLLESLSSSVSAAQRAGLSRLHISHLKTSGKENWSKLEAALDIFQTASAAGMRMTADRYPYIESMTQLSVIMPPPLDNMNDFALEKYLSRPENFREAVTLLSQYPETRWRTVRLVSSRCRDVEAITGDSLWDIAQRLARDPAQLCAVILAADASGAMAAFRGMCQENMMTILRQPFTVCGTDESARPPDYSIGRSHPRGFGAFPLFFKYLKPHLPWAEIIRKMTSLPAEIFNVPQRGRIAPGCFADLVIFDPERMDSSADFKHSHQFAAGIVQVRVNGVTSFDEGKFCRRRSGRIIFL